MAIEDVSIAENVTYTKALEILGNNNLSELEINTLIWGVLGESLGKTKRVFSYGETFSADAPACAATFARTFVHTDWIDGESVVQAEENSIEEGFNSRFHNIEADLDALSADITKAFGCIADMRASLADRLTELRTEINHINSDIYDCCKSGSGSGGGIVYPGGGFYYPYQPPYNVPPMTTPGPIVDPYGPIGPVFTDPYGPLGPSITDKPWVADNPVWRDRPWTYSGGLGDWLSNIGKTTYPGPAVTRSVNDPTRATVAGMPARRLDVQTFNGQIYEVWSTNSGIVMTPAETGVAAADQIERSWNSQRSKLVGDVAEWAADNQEALARMLEGGTTVGAIADKLGDARLDGGSTLRDALSVLPSSTKLAKQEDLLDLMADRAATAVARDGLAAETLVANVGFNTQFATIADVPMTGYKAVPLEARKALVDKGIKTLGAFRKATPAQIARILTDSGIKVTPAEVARWSGEAAVLDKIASRVGGGNP